MLSDRYERGTQRGDRTTTTQSVEQRLEQIGASLEQLRAQIKGRVITAEDDDFDEARNLFYGGFDRRPAFIVRAAEAADVARVVTLARDAGLELAVRSGGHSAAGHSVCEGGVVLDLKDMHSIEVDPQRRMVWVEPGATAGEVTAAVSAHNLVIGFGDTGSVGVGGITLGGGIGYMVRKHGLTIDNLLAAEMVTADGTHLRVDSRNHPDLFWAIRGGGGNFGVVTRFLFQLHPLEAFTGGMLVLPAQPEVLTRFLELAEAAPEELSTIANIMPAPPAPFIPSEHHGKLIIWAFMAFAGDPDTGQRVLAPFRALAEPIVDMLRPMQYHEMFPPEEGGYHPTAVSRTFFVDRIDLDAARLIIERLKASDAVMRVAQLRVLGGAMARVPSEATAFAHRKSHIMVNLASIYTSPEDMQARNVWVEDFAASLRQSDLGSYSNFMSLQETDRIQFSYPGRTWDRLREIKARYDPTNLFHMNHNIPPLG